MRPRYSYSKEVTIEEERFRRLIAWQNGGLVGPIHIDVELHKRCNLYCIYCTRDEMGLKLNAESKRTELGLNTWLSVVRQAAALGIRVWNIEGANEPMAHPDTFRVLQEVKAQGMYGTMTTNGTLWDDERTQGLVEMGWDRLHVSVDGVTAKVHDFCRKVPGGFDKIMRFLSRLDHYKREKRAEWPMLNINAVVNNRNYWSLPEFVELAREHNADYLFVEPVIAYHENAMTMKLDEDQRKELPRYVRKAARLAEKYGIDNNFGTHDRNLDDDLVQHTGDINRVHLGDVEQKPEHGLLSSPCYKPWMYIAIKSDGLVGHCGLIKGGEHIQQKSLADIWHSSHLTAVRRRMLNKQLGEHCTRCCPSDITQRRRWRRIFENALENQGRVNVHVCA